MMIIVVADVNVVGVEADDDDVDVDVDQMMHCSREAKHRLEMDWSDKYSAQHLGKCLLIYLTPRIYFIYPNWDISNS